jgi:hypothetical protein
MSQPADLICHTFAPLRVEETRADLVVSGGTFRFVFAKANGLIGSVRVLGREWLSRRPVPDLWCSAAVDPRGERWEAARETQAEVRVREQSGDRIVIEARGRYLSASGAPAPLRYHLTYTVACDGVVQVEVENTGTGPGALRWLVFSAATVRRSMVEFYSHIGDLAETEDTGGWVTRLLPEDTESQELYTARILPWLQLGSSSAGLDLVVDHAEEISHGWTDSMPQADPLGRAGTNFVLASGGGRVSWTYFAIRNLFTPVRPGWHRYNRFYLSAVPAKEYRPALADLRAHWLGPHQWRDRGFSYPSDQAIAELARRGINLIIGGAHWRSGDYRHPDDPREIGRLIKACHRHGIRIIPYITFTDLEHDTPAFPDHGQEWQIEPVAEYRHDTNLMCYAAEGWREHWKREVDTILERFDFDGLYIDFWVGKMACRNLLHGCGHKYPRFTLPGLREMAWHAFRGVKAKGPDQFVLANTNLFAGALINNLVDIRLPGEWANVEETPEELIRGHLNSRRLGCNALLLRRAKVSLRSVSFSLRCQSPMVLTHGASAEGAPGLLTRYADLLRFFGIGRARTQSAFEEDGSLVWTGAGGTVYWSRTDRGALIVLANLAAASSKGTLRVAKPAALGLSARRRYLVYRPDLGKLAADEPVFGNKIRSLALLLRPCEPALVFLTPYQGRPQVLWATNSDGIADERYDARARRLTFTVRGASGGRSQVTLYVGAARVVACNQSGAVAVRRRGGLALLDVACNEPVRVSFAR